MSRTVIHWFRRDLRLGDNPALCAAAKAGRVVPVYILDPDEGMGAASKWWLDRSLRALASSLERRKSGLVVRKGDPLKVLTALAKECGATRIVWNRLYEPPAVAGDRRVKEGLASRGFEVETFKGSLLYEPWEVETNAGGPFKVFTPFWRKARLREPDRPSGPPGPLGPLGKTVKGLSIDALSLRPAIGWDAGLAESWTPGESGAKKALRRFLSDASMDYAEGRNIPGERGTSRLSPHLHFGELAPHRAWWDHVEGGPSPERQDAFLNELGWREFAHHILFHFPKTTDAPMDARFENFPWRRSARDLAAWRKGVTGYPIVDAGMRELWRTGWMHNRVRMVVASFLVKHLGSDWREGMRWFWDTLVDADLAANTMGWQWSAGCGADAAPFFRVFNPILQGEKFDPKGEYVRRWIPELGSVDDRWVHKPWEAPEPPPGYPPPIVDHKIGRARALGLYERWRGPKNISR